MRHKKHKYKIGSNPTHRKALIKGLAGEVIKHGKNGLIVDFHDHSQLAKTVTEVLDNPSDYDSIRKSARETIVKNYDLTSICLPQHLKLIESLI